MFDQEMLIHFFCGKVEAPKVAFVLAGRIFLSLIDDSQVDVMRARGRHAGDVKEAESNCFVKTMFAAPMKTSLLNASAEVELAPLGFVRLAEIVAGLEMVAAI